jgi:Flp pilus assembly pilin Flp
MMWTGFKRLLKDRDGSTVVEFGFVAPVLVLAITAVMEFAFLLFVGALFQSAVLDASRAGTTGFAPAGIGLEQRIRDLVSERTLGLVDPAEVTITTLVYPSFPEVGAPEPYDDANANGSFDAGENFTDVNGNGVWDSDMGVAGLGGPNDIVVYRIDYNWGALTALFQPFLGAVARTASLVVRNEPY